MLIDSPLRKNKILFYGFVQKTHNSTNLDQYLLAVPQFLR